MRNVKFIFLVMVLVLLLAACNNNSTTDPSQGDDGMDITKLSNESITSQKPSNQAKDILRKHEEITVIKAINTREKLLIAIEIEHHERFTLAQLRDEYTKEMKDKFKDMKIELSTDKKISIELEKLEQQINEGSLSNKQLEKKVDKLIKLAKDQA